ncbi:hypothetical protein PRIC1_000492 [Phytophthora ramorum]
METGSSSVRVFDGTTDFRVWRARVENELMRYHLLGYVLVRGYDGSQSFSFNGEQVPPRYPVIHVDDDMQQSVVKEETPSCGRQGAAANQQGRLSRWDVLGESAEAKSILQRFLHPDVECAILNKNIYDSWKMLCALYGNRSNPGAHDVYEMHRVLHHIRLGDKKGEPVREFVTRWEMLMQQYALATGIDLTDGFRSVSLVQTLPSAWRPMVESWRGVRPFVPYPELVDKVIATRERMQAETEAANAPTPTASRLANGSTSSSVDTHTTLLPDKSAASVQPVTRPAANFVETAVDNAVDKVVEKHASKPAERRAAEVPKVSETATKPSKSVPPTINVMAEANNTVDLTSGELSSSSETNKARASRSLNTAKKSPTERSDIATTPRTSKPPEEKGIHEKSREENDGYDKRESYGKNSKYESVRGYSKYGSHDRYDKSPRTSRNRYEKKYDSYDRFDSNKSGPVSCFYCLKVGHHMKRCWYLKADIENGTTHDLHKKFSCAVTIDRNEFMVKCLESYIDEENRARASYGASASTPRSHRDYEVMESVGRIYNSQQQEFVPLPGQPPSYAFRSDQQSASASSAAPDYRKRSHSVFQRAEDRISSRGPRLNRSRSVYRSTDVAEDFSPRKRSRAPSFERQLQGYY